MGEYVELHCHSAYSLLDGASTVEALVAQAAHLGMSALALTDHDALYGAVPFVAAARAAGVQPILGAELTMEDGCHLTLLVENAQGWRNLCHLITTAQKEAPKGLAALPWAALQERSTGLICLSGCRQGPVAGALLAWDRQRAFRAARHLHELFPGRLYIELQHHLRPDDGALIDQLHRLAGYLQLPVVVTNNVHYALRSGQRLQDTLHAIRRRTPLDALAAELRPNDEYYLKPHGRLFPLFRLGQHSGGMVVMGPPLSERVPVEPAAMANRSVTQWDKDALEAAGIIKIDVLGLRALSAISEALDWMERLGMSVPDFTRCGYDDPAVYQMLAAADSLGVFQVESRAQSTVLPRLQPSCLDDLVVAVSLIRPGPVQGQMVHPYLRRRAGEEPMRYPHPCLEPVLRDTLGVLLFQEQVLQVAEAAAGWSLGRGELLRRALGKGDEDAITALQAAFIADAGRRGIDGYTAEQVFAQLVGFAGYSFPRSHAAAFATIVYQHAWLKRYAPAPFYVSLLNHQPMGFWSPAVLVADAKRHGVRFLPIDVNASDGHCTIEDGTIRIGLSYVGGLGENGAQAVLVAREAGPFRDLHDLCRRTRLPRMIVEQLILAGGLDGFSQPRRALLWALGGLRYAEHELDLNSPLPEVNLQPLTHWELQRQEEAVLGLTVGDHAFAALGRWLGQQGLVSSRGLRRGEDGSKVMTAGVLVVRQSPPTAKGHTFLTLEDEHGLIDVILRPSTAARYKATLRDHALLRVTGMLQHGGGIISVLAWHVEPLLVPGSSK